MFFLGVWCLLVAPVSNPRKFPQKSFSNNLRKISGAKVSPNGTSGQVENAEVWKPQYRNKSMKMGVQK